MHLITFGTCFLEYMDQTQVVFFTVPGLAWEVALKKTEAELELSRDIDVLLMVEKEIRGGETCNTIDV